MVDGSLLPAVLALGGGYLLGSVPFGLVLTRLAGVGDIRRTGSGNIGATNVLRTGRRDLAALTLLLDAGKGAAAALAAPAFVAGSALGTGIAVAAIWGVVLGHTFPVWLRFSGGKGVATALGALAGVAPLAALACGVVWLAVAGLFRYSSLAALAATAAMPAAVALLGTGVIPAESLPAWALAPVAALIWLRHHANIRRLLRGEETKIRLGLKGRKDSQNRKNRKEENSRDDSTGDNTDNGTGGNPNSDAGGGAETGPQTVGGRPG